MSLELDDHIAVSEHIAKYCWTVDSGDGTAWAALWTSDGAFVIEGQEPVVGRDELALVPPRVLERYNGAMFHNSCNFWAEYAATRDKVFAHIYNQVSSFSESEGLRVRGMAKQRLILTRTKDGWLIERNDTVLVRR